MTQTCDANGTVSIRYKYIVEAFHAPQRQTSVSMILRSLHCWLLVHHDKPVITLSPHRLSTTIRMYLDPAVRGGGERIVSARRDQPNQLRRVRVIFQPLPSPSLLPAALATRGKGCLWETPRHGNRHAKVGVIVGVHGLLALPVCRHAGGQKRHTRRRWSRKTATRRCLLQPVFYDDWAVRPRRRVYGLFFPLQ